MLRLNKKGNYPLAMIVTVFICSIWLIVSISAVYDKLGQRFGVVQSAVLDLTGDMRLVETQLEIVSGFSIDKALADLPKSPQVGRGCNYGHVTVTVADNVLLCPVMNDPDIPIDVCVPDVLSAFNEVFNDNLDAYISKYDERQEDVSIPYGSFEIMPFREYTAVVGTKPVNITMHDQSGLVVGQASFRPAFKILPDPILSHGYPLMMEDVKDIATFCHDAQNISVCIEDVIQPPETYQKIDSKYVVIYPWHPTPWCFAFNLPGTIEV